MRKLFAIGMAAVFATLAPTQLFACAACYGKSVSALAQGMNWGIFTLLGVVGMVLGGIATFFVFLAKKSATISAGKADAASPEPTQKL